MEPNGWRLLPALHFHPKCEKCWAKTAAPTSFGSPMQSTCKRRRKLCLVTAFPCSTCSAHLRIKSFGHLNICVKKRQPVGCCLWWELRFGNALQHIATTWLVGAGNPFVACCQSQGKLMHRLEPLPKFCQWFKKCRGDQVSPHCHQHKTK